MFSRLEAATRQNLHRSLNSTSLVNRTILCNVQRLSLPGTQVATLSRSTFPSSTRRHASSRTSTAREGQDGPPPPRFLRRQALQKASQSGKQEVAAGRPTRKCDTMTLLDPYILAKRLRTLCEYGKLDDAVAMLKNSPRDAMNAPVWNTVIWESMKVRRFQLAYKLYVDMKRRGFSPTTRTYQTMFTGLSKIEQWSSHAQQLSNARLLYDSFQRHITSLKKHDPESTEITPVPLAAYIKILGDNGQYEEIFDVYHALDSYGPFTPDANIYTAMFHAISNMRRVLSGKGITAPDQWDNKVAADAWELWLKLSKSSTGEGPSSLADPFTTTTAISALSKGTEKDQILAFKIVEEYFGLSKDPGKVGSGYHKLSPAALGSILRLCNDSGEYEACASFLQQVKERPVAIGGLSIIDRPHVEEVLKAKFHLPNSGRESLHLLEWMLRQERAGHGGHIRPASSTYNLVLSACFKSHDWASAAIAFELMTGYSAQDFQTSISVTSPPKKHGHGQILTPTAEAMSFLIRTAASTRQLRYIQQSLRMIEHVGIDHIHVGAGKQNPKKDTKNNLFYGSKLAIAAAECVKVLTMYKDECLPAELARWRALATRCKEDFDRPQAEGYIPTKLGDRPLKPARRTRL